MFDPTPHSLSFHGGRLDEAARRFRDAPVPWLDLSTGINPGAWQAPAGIAADLRALPSGSDLKALNGAAAGMMGADHVAVAALPGSEIGLRLVAQLGLPRPWRIVGPGYRTHAAALPGAEAIGADAVLAEGARGGTLLLANPNNPDGRLWQPRALLALARALAAAGGVLVIDEAFADAVPDASILPLLSADDRVLVFRSFGKFFGLAGVRLGFAFGAGDLVASLGEMLGSWPVSATAIALGTAAYRDRPWIDATRARLRADADALDGLLARHGLTAGGACPLFRLVETDEAPGVFERLARAGILTRPFDHAPRWLRFGLPGDAAERARLDRALRHG
ncbi:threonine-phosphate decarboxylase [uncultured Sphingomonas sp.]|uniref:threonine-phosphate decarboxylase n=1 Tax=uncultured Sphingomonas sp. TaxID=158754 RepID=UPI0025E691CD|nr:threonine-phosphate decarboxylase [uncultured Sphingomonas sp.]